ncbi:hypothetical protein SAMD00019534_119470 [Acytostelium subglobosum LB1]|uniref:hypothetical protein n=1 Tax=Acytostelium subglobosum LB1 TaxID=1410327 RepID=UPI0006449166|nr:hypothetical protein SAMD00019534_119470 [Acytostelium subglobosum LB1]GAM28771.1 hypothetical protein SAMD00019534_119470 [Acytostelium subglobosum LB1]|eukprot:XP_012748326.1 hypothetical protein SAMD00019534_119470 [Acytostelium subglobosum LB1]
MLTMSTLDMSTNLSVHYGGEHMLNDIVRLFNKPICLYIQLTITHVYIQNVSLSMAG